MGYMGTDYRRVKENLKLRTYRNRYKNLKNYFLADKTGLRLGHKKLSPEAREKLRQHIINESEAIKRKNRINIVIAVLVGIAALIFIIAMIWF